MKDLTRQEPDTLANVQNAGELFGALQSGSARKAAISGQIPFAKDIRSYEPFAAESSSANE